MSEQFNLVEPFRDEDGTMVMEIETDAQWDRHHTGPTRVGLLWTGSTWLTVAAARDMREWLNKVIP